MVAPPLRKSVQSTANFRVRRNLFGKMVLQIEESTEHYTETPPPFYLTDGKWTKHIKYTTYKWRDAALDDVLKVDIRVIHSC